MILPRTNDRDVVVFHLVPSMAYTARIIASFALMAVGLGVQAVTGSVLPGVILIAAGNLLLLVRGYDNRVDTGKFHPDAEWERVDMQRLDELTRMDRRMRAWDTSALDVSNPLGGALFILISGAMLAAALLVGGPLRILMIDGMVLLLPHWVTGIRSILVQPKLMVRIEFVKKLLERCEHDLADHTVNLLMLLRGGTTKLPEDVKFKVDIRDRREGFLGLYGQIVINEVQGSSYPYFYVVLVAKKGFGLLDLDGKYSPPGQMVSEVKLQDQVEVLVIRQLTTKTSGYHTNAGRAAEILEEGLRVAKQFAVTARAQSLPA